LPGIEDWTVRLESPEVVDETMTLDWLSEAVAPAGETEAIRLTVPEKLLRLVTVIEDVPEKPELNSREVALLAMLKSGAAVTFTIIVTVLTSEPLIPVTVTLYSPSGVPLVPECVVIVRPDIAVPEGRSWRVEGLRLAPGTLATIGNIS
jgi:hypothetical protein